MSVQRHKRAFSKHVDSLIFSGVVEKVLVGELKTGCLRLAKYNPDYVASQAGPSTLAAAAIEEDALDPAMAESDLSELHCPISFQADSVKRPATTISSTSVAEPRWPLIWSIKSSSSLRTPGRRA